MLIERYQFSPNHLMVLSILKANLFVGDLTLFEADSVYQFFYHTKLDLIKLYDTFK